AGRPRRRIGGSAAPQHRPLHGPVTRRAVPSSARLGTSFAPAAARRPHFSSEGGRLWPAGLARQGMAVVLLRRNGGTMAIGSISFRAATLIGMTALALAACSGGGDDGANTPPQPVIT